MLGVSFLRFPSFHPLPLCCSLWYPAPSPFFFFFFFPSALPHTSSPFLPLQEAEALGPAEEWRKAGRRPLNYLSQSSSSSNSRGEQRGGVRPNAQKPWGSWASPLKSR